ncbi:MAG: hypothetical protein Q9214_008089, partial [Letrouitia sp. 1 TL-2023]
MAEEVKNALAGHHTQGNSKSRKLNNLENAELRQRTAEAQQIYGRGKKISARSVKDKKLRSNLKSLEE